MTKLTVVLVAGLGLTVGSLRLFAHHAFAAEFDATRPVRISGVVTKVEWTNPHAHFYIDVQENGGKALNWELELGSPNALQREGWTRNSLKPGDHVVVRGFVARDGSKLANARDVRLADGRRVFAGSSVGGAPTSASSPPLIGLQSPLPQQ